MRFPLQKLSLLFVCLACLVASGCGGGGSNGPNGPGPTAMSVSAATARDLTATLSQEQATVSPDTTVVYTLTLTNNTAAPVTFKTQQFADSPPVLGSLQVLDDKGNVARPGYPFDGTGPLTEMTLTPGQSLQQRQYELPYNETAPQWTHFRGRYQAFATFTVDGTNTRVGPLAVTIR